MCPQVPGSQLIEMSLCCIRVARVYMCIYPQDSNVLVYVCPQVPGSQLIEMSLAELELDLQMSTLQVLKERARERESES